MELNPDSGALGCRFLVEQVSHDAALVDVMAVDTGRPGVHVVVDDIQLQAALGDCDPVVDGYKITLSDFQTCTVTQ